ncbi:hypothetical protein Tco_0832372, partial [Tanacetum coccineum]
ITPANDNNPFEALPSSDTVIEYVNTLGYPSTLRNVSAMSVNALYQPWRAILSMINMCLTGKTAGFDRPRHHVCWKGWKGSLCMPIPDALLTDEITSAPYYSRYLEHVDEYQRCLDEEHKATKSKTAKQTKPSTPKASKETSDAPSPAKRSKVGKVKKQRKPKIPLQLVDELVDEGALEQEPVYGDEEADIQRAVELSIKEQAEHTQGPARLVVINEPDSGRIQPLPDAGPNPDEQDEGQVGPNPGIQDEGQAGSNPGDAAESQPQSSHVVHVGPNPGIQDEGQAGSNPGDAAESQPQSSHVVHAGPNLEHMDFEVTNASTQQNPEQIDEEFTTTAYPSVQENLKLPTEDQVILEEPASSAGTLSSLQNLDKELSFTNQFLVEKSQEDEPDKSNTEAEVQSMVTVPIHQDTSSVPLMTTLVIDLKMSQPVSTTVQAPLPTSTATITAITTTTSLPPPLPQPQ